ncbi:MAG: diaminopimelate decarboxylase [Candidatus Promineifilaceae bacterium]
MTSSHFHYRAGALFCEETPISEIAHRVGTPIYVYSQAELLGRAIEAQQAAAALSSASLICFALKANGNPALLRMLAAAGLGADVTSQGELFLARHASIPPEKIVFSGVGKTPAEIRTALESGIKALHVESADELDAIGEIAAARGRSAPISIRVNPDITVSTHPHIGTGARAHKFGIQISEVLALLDRAERHPCLQPVGLAVHIGSQITDLASFQSAAHALVALAREAAARGVALAYLDVGGGLAVAYAKEMAPTLADWISAAGAPIAQAGFDLVLEPGRSLVAAAGCLVTTVLYAKEQGGKRFVITDAGMTDLLRPALYGAYHAVWPVRQRTGRLRPVDVVGPVCESSDVLASQRELPELSRNDLLAVMDVGAYGYAMSSNYNGRLRPAEVLVSGTSWRPIRQRQQLEELLAGCSP